MIRREKKIPDRQECLEPDPANQLTIITQK